MTIKLLFFAGSSRAESCNKKLAQAACEYAKSKGAQATFLDLRDYPMPIYDGDLEDESGLPEHAIKFKKQLIAHDGFFITSPEYNSSFSPLLKNALDWASRPHTENETPLLAYKDKVIALGAASPGGLGGLRGLVPLRMMLGNIATHLIPNQFALGGAYGAFDDSGALKDEKQQKMLAGVIDQLIETTTKMKK